MSDLRKQIQPPKLGFDNLGSQKTFDSWYSQYIRPLFDNAIVVTGDDNDGDGWAMFHSKSFKSMSHTHIGLLIGVEKINKGVTKNDLKQAAMGHFSYLEVQRIFQKIQDEGLSGD